jgi:hypothetical protein
LANHSDAVPGTNVVFVPVKDGGKIVSDVDAFCSGAAISIKRQGKTLDEWARPGNKSDEWLKNYMKKIKEGGGSLPPSGRIEFWTGKELPSQATMDRLSEIALKADIEISFKSFDLLPPPTTN